MSKSLVNVMSSGLRVKSGLNGMSTDFRGWIGPVQEPSTGAWQRNMETAAPASLLSYPALYGCVARISGDVSKLGAWLKLLQMDDAQGITVPAPKTSPYWLTLRTPNSYQNIIQFIRYWLICKLLWGNTYAVKERDGRGIVRALYLIDPRKVQPVVSLDGGVYYSISGDDLARMPAGMMACPADDIIHDRGPTLWHQLIGVPPLYAAALSGTLGLRIQQQSTKFFANQSRPGGVLKTAQELQPEVIQQWKENWDNNFSGAGAGKTAVLANGLEYETISVVAEQAQLVEQLGISAVDVATAFGMPAYKINQGQMPTSNNVQALNQQYYSDCLQSYIEEFELCMQQGLGLPDGYSIEFDLAGLLRMDSLTHMDVLTKGVKGGLLKPNEGRKELNLPGVKGGDTIYLQEQEHSLEALAKRDAREDPFAKGGAPAPTPAPPAEATKAMPADLNADDIASVLKQIASEPLCV